MRVYWGCNVVAGRFPNAWEPAICTISLANGNFLSRWSIFNFSKGHNPTQIKFACGVSEVTAAQQAAIAADPVNIFLLTATEITQAFSTLQAAARNRISGVCKTIGIAAPQSSEILSSVWDRLSVATANQTLTQLETQLDADIATAAAQKLLIPGIVGLSGVKDVSRRTLLKASGIGLAYWLLPKRQAHSTVVFTDSFTVGSDTLMDGSYPDWADIAEAGSEPLFVYNATDIVITSDGFDPSFGSARITNAAAPNGDQRITADLYSNSQSIAMLLTRCAVGSADFYLALFDSFTNLVEIYRTDAGSHSLLLSQSRGVGYPTVCSFEASGTGGTVTLTAVGGGTSPVTTSDSSSPFTSGKSGIRLYHVLSDPVAYIDNVSVDNLVATGAVRHRAIIQ